MANNGYRKIANLGTVGQKKHIQKDVIKKAVTDDTREQLEKEGKTLFNRVNRRIRTLERNRSKVVSPAYEALLKKRGSAPRFGGASIMRGDLDTLQKEIAMAREWDLMETSNMSGARAYTNNLRSKLNVSSKQHLSADFISDIFDALHALHERMPDVLYQNQLQYANYLDTIIEQAENVDLSKLDSAERVETLVTSAIDKLSTQVTNAINDDIDEVSKLFDTKLY